jgi:hypothetical protein
MLWAIGTTTIGWDALVFWAWGSEDWLAKTTEFAAQGASAVPCGEYGGGPRSNWPCLAACAFRPAAAYQPAHAAADSASRSGLSERKAHAVLGNEEPGLDHVCARQRMLIQDWVGVVHVCVDTFSNAR